MSTLKYRCVPLNCPHCGTPQGLHIDSATKKVVTCWCDNCHGVSELAFDTHAGHLVLDWRAVPFIRWNTCSFCDRWVNYGDTHEEGGCVLLGDANMRDARWNDTCPHCTCRG
jgi:hypothetical protein